MLCPEELIAAVTVSAISISKSLSAADTALLSAVFVQLGDTLATIAAAKDRSEQLSQDLGCNGDASN